LRSSRPLWFEKIMTQKENKFDVIVIGGGVIGLCSAYYLNRAGYQVALLEKGNLGSGSSSGNAGLIVPSHFIPLAAPGVVGQGLKWMLDPESPFYIKPRLNGDLLRWLWQFRRASTQAHLDRSMPLLLEMHLASLALYEQLADELNFGLVQNGLLMLYKTANGEVECAELVETAHHLDLAAELFDAEQVRAKLPGLAVDVVGGAYFPRDGHLNPGRLITALKEALEQAGVTLFTQTEVVGMTESRGKIERISTTKGQFTADEIVLAGGSWSPKIARELGVKLPIQAAKGYSFMAPHLAGKLQVPLLLTDAKVAVTPLAEGIRFAGTLEMTGLDVSVNQRRVAAMRRAVPDYLPEFALTEQPIEQIEVWAGLRPCSPDGLPIIGRDGRIGNLILATGHAMMGVSLAPITGMIVAEIVAREASSIEMGLLGTKRF
jgi:D-amino-acid dehydrogenase